MGSITNLKTNKTLFIPCDCTSELLMIEFDHETNTAEFCIYESKQSFLSKLSIWQRFRYAMRFLLNKYPYTDQIILQSKQLAQLRSFLVSLDL